MVILFGDTTDPTSDNHAKWTATHVKIIGISSNNIHVLSSLEILIRVIETIPNINF